MKRRRKQLAGKLITNDEKILVEKMRNVIPNCEAIYALVGYFYFSGFSELSGDIKDKKMKILVGMDIDTAISGMMREVDLLNKIDDERSGKEIRKEYYEKLRTLINETNLFDNPEKETDLKLFLKKIREGSLEIRKTRKPNHAKMYLFENDEKHNESGDYPGILVTGSSNFSYSGLSGRNEINVIFRDKPEFEEGMTLFKKLWSDSVELVSDITQDDFFNEVNEKIWTEKVPNPILLLIRALSEYFSFKNDAKVKLPYSITKKKFSNFKYQTDAINKAIKTIERHNGVIIADVVGLGKSVISSAVAHNLNLSTIVIVPPHLIDQWENYRVQFNYNARVFSSGKIEDAVKYMNYDEKYLIIVDEAARYRNSGTKDYANLHKLCQGNKVMLLTATPFNNRPEDIFSLIRLFQIPTKSTIRTVQDLSGAFRSLVREYSTIQKLNRKGSLKGEELKEEIQKISVKIRELIFPVVIRRTRIDLDVIEEYKEDLETQGIFFPKVEEPILETYKLGKLAPIYEKTTEAICPKKEQKNEKTKSFIGAKYKPLTYMKKESLERMKKELSASEFRDLEYLIMGQKHLSGFMRTLLVRRFESSIDAFRKSVESMLNSTINMKNWYDKGKIILSKSTNIPDVESFLTIDGEEVEMFSEEIDEKLDDLKNKKDIKYFDSSDISDEFGEDLESDIKLLTKIKKEWSKIDYDPKLESFSNILKDHLRKDSERKIVVFSEFADTVNYLHEKLKYGLEAMKYTSKEATRVNKEKIEQNFDAGLDEKEQEDEFKILIATDAISEGYNLHRAGTIFNYDIPYNPTRVIQRVGRINRVNRKMFDSLYIYNYFPSDEGEKDIGVKTISTFKMAMIHALIGEDAQILTSDEEVNRYFAEKLKEEKSSEDDESWDAKYKNMLYFLEKNEKALFEAALTLPHRSRVKRTKKTAKKGVLVFGRKGDECAFKLAGIDNEIMDISTEDAFSLMEAEISEKGEKVSDDFASIYKKAKDNLFEFKSGSKGSKHHTETIESIKILKIRHPEKKDYIEELIYSVNKLFALPNMYMKLIRDVAKSDDKDEFAKIEKEIPYKYLTKLRRISREIDSGKESIILAEELV